VFFLFGAAQTAQQDGASVLTGAGLGILLGVLTGYVIYRGLVRIPLRHLFGVIGWMLIVLAAGMASQAADNLVMIDMLPALIDPLWNTSAVLSESSMMGEVLHVMMGYSDQPSGMQMLTFVLALALMTLVNQRVRSSTARPAVQESPAAA